VKPNGKQTIPAENAAHFFRNPRLLILLPSLFNS
jgi:hypothetical protein